MKESVDIQEEVREAKKRWGFASEEHMLLVVGTYDRSWRISK